MESGARKEGHPVLDEDRRDPWEVEAELIELNERDFDIAYSARWCGDDLEEEGDFTYTWDDLSGEDLEEFIEWLDVLLENACSLLALEQSCYEGELLSWDMRAVRLASAPGPALRRLHLLWDSVSSEVRSALAFYVYWLVRADRARRTGKPDWSPRDPMPPVTQQVAFRASRYRIRRPW
jgi:hypothetical protein